MLLSGKGQRNAKSWFTPDTLKYSPKLHGLPEVTRATSAQPTAGTGVARGSRSLARRGRGREAGERRQQAGQQHGGATTVRDGGHGCCPSLGCVSGAGWQAIVSRQCRAGGARGYLVAHAETL
jgi:hypothetical protein